MIEFSNVGSRLFTGKDKGEFKYNFVNDKNVEQIKADFKKMGIELEAKQCVK